MIRTYIIITILIFSVEALTHLKNITTSIYPRRPRLISKNEDMLYFVVYIVFIGYGILSIFML